MKAKPRNNLAGILQGRLFKGWGVVAAAAVVYAVVIGSMVSFSNFIKPISEGMDWSRTSVTLAIGILVIIGGIFAVVMGYICDRRGPRMVVLLGGISLGLGFYLTSRMDTLWQFYIFYGLLAGIAYACTFVPLTATVSRWFTNRRGLALGILYAGGGIGGLILSPLVSSWIERYGWRDAWLILAIIAWCTIIPLGTLLIREPRDLELQPLNQDGLVASHVPQDGAVSQITTIGRGTAVRDYTVTEAVRTRFLWLLSLAAMLTFTALLLAERNLVPYATDHGIAAATAATVLGVMAAFDAAGKLGIGLVSDKIGSRPSVLFCLLIATVMLFFLLVARQPWMFYAYAILCGFVSGGTLVLLPRIVAEKFGTRSMGAIMGVCAIFVSIGPAMGPVLGAMVYDRTGDYSPAIFVGGLAVALALGILFVILPKKGSEAIPT